MEEKECPICGEVKPIEEGFGLRQKPEGLRPNSWCRDCRSKGYSKARINTQRENPPLIVKPLSNIRKLYADAEARNKLAQAAMQTPEQTERLKKFCEPVLLPTVDDFLLGAQLKKLAKDEKDKERAELRKLYHEKRPNDTSWDKRSINFIRKRLGI